MFRKLYWVAERFDASGQSEVVGVYTSIPDLIDTCLSPLSGSCPDGLRLGLFKLDSAAGALESWKLPDGANLSDALQPYLDSGEFSIDERNMLVDAVVAFK